MKELAAVNPYLLRYRGRLILGILFIISSNYFGIIAPQMTGYIVDRVEGLLSAPAAGLPAKKFYDPLVSLFIRSLESLGLEFSTLVMLCGAILLLAALARGFFMYLMRQTLVVMSRHIEFDQKNDVYRHYQSLDAEFYKTHAVGDLMSRMAEDVGRVRMYTGPAIMYLVNLTALIGFSLFYMFRENMALSLYVLSPLPILAVAIYYVNDLINRRSERIQSQLSDLTTQAQETYSGIRVIKSFVQEASMSRFFSAHAEAYRGSALALARVEAVYFPSIGLLIGLSTLLTICIGGIYQIDHVVSSGTIAEFVVYINMLAFPVSAIGWVASMIQRAAASQKRLNEFMQTSPAIATPSQPHPLAGFEELRFNNTGFTFPHSGIRALDSFNLTIRRGEKIAVIGRTGSGKSTLAQLIMRAYDPDTGSVTVNGRALREYDLADWRGRVSYVPQDVFLFSDTVGNNIRFGAWDASEQQIRHAARLAAVEDEIDGFPQGFDTQIGERGVTLSGGQKQRISIARALCKEAELLVFDDCLSAVDARTEKHILSGLHDFLRDRTAVIITHRIFSLFDFDMIIVIEDGRIAEQGRHETLIARNGIYAELYRRQQALEEEAPKA